MIADDATFPLPVVIDETRDADAGVPAEFKAVQWTSGRRYPSAYGYTMGGDGSRGQVPDEAAIAAICARVERLLAGFGAGPASDRPPGGAGGEAAPSRTTN